MEIYLIRHTTPLIEAGVCYGQSDIPIGDDFETESEEVIKNLPISIDVVYASPLKRCAMLAEKITASIDHLEMPLIDARLAEMNFGKWELKKWCEIDRNEFRHWEEDIVLNPVPAGESFAGMSGRVNNFLKELKRSGYQSVLIITHAGVIRCAMSILEHIPLADTLKIPIEYGAIRKLLM